jgi:hypothetical protein
VGHQGKDQSWRVRRWPTRAALLVVGLAALASAGCSSEGDEGAGSAAIVAQPTTQDFCAVYREVPTDPPESYVGSDAHLQVVAELLGASPAEIEPAVETFHAFVVSGAITDVPSTKDRENWPTPVVRATDEIQAYGTAHC